MISHSPPDPLHALLGMRYFLSDQVDTYTAAWQHLLLLYTGREGTGLLPLMFLPRRFQRGIRHLGLSSH